MKKQMVLKMYALALTGTFALTACGSTAAKTGAEKAAAKKAAQQQQQAAAPAADPDAGCIDDGLTY